MLVNVGPTTGNPIRSVPLTLKRIPFTHEYDTNRRPPRYEITVSLRWGRILRLYTDSARKAYYGLTSILRDCKRVGETYTFAAILDRHLLHSYVVTR